MEANESAVAQEQQFSSKGFLPVPQVQAKPEWQPLMNWPGAHLCDMNGHHLVVQPDRIAGRRWYKWFDGHFRGSAPSLVRAKTELEQAAISGASWGAKL